MFSLNVLIMATNYSHDIATAFLAVSGVAMWILSASHPAVGARSSDEFFIASCRSVTRIAKYSLIWILAAGFPRIVFYETYEWNDSAGDLQIAAIIVKHIVMFALVGAGIYHWARLERKTKKPALLHGSIGN
ncbi:MAG: hypothetical protein EPN22_16610 [Nitrospirae bacterium]|nr:MAG: hypothetical protein EPN22_16610 [Nitrospirota bacterium]